MFSVKYKFPAWKDEEIKMVHFDGANISVAEMRTAVANQTQCDPLDLVFKDHATNEQFPDEGTIPRNSYIMAYRTISKRTSTGAPMRQPRRHAPNVPPPENYVCDRCRGSGHYKANCPTIDNPAFDAGFATPAGIPSSMTVSASVESGTIRLANGTIAALKTHHETLDAVAEQRRQKEETYASIPESMRCTISRDLLQDPHTVPCCKSNFCAKCILPDSIHDAIQCPNCSKNVTGDKITANSILAQEILLWRTENNFLMDISPTPINLLPISSSPNQGTVKVERRKPPPRRGAAAPANGDSNQIASPIPSTTSTIISSPSIDSNTSVNSRSPSTPSGYAPHPLTRPIKSENSYPLPEAPIHRDPPSDSQARLEKLKASRLAASSANHRAYPSSGHDSKSNSSPTPSSGSHTNDTRSNTQEKRDLSPNSRLKQIAALRAAKRGSPIPSAPVPNTAPLSTSETHPSHTDTFETIRKEDDDHLRRASPNGNSSEPFGSDRCSPARYDRKGSSSSYDDRNGGSRRDSRRDSPQIHHDDLNDRYSRSSRHGGDEDYDRSPRRGSSRRQDAYDAYDAYDDRYDEKMDSRPSSSSRHHDSRDSSSSRDYSGRRDDRGRGDYRDDRRDRRSGENESSHRHRDSRRYTDEKSSSNGRRDSGRHRSSGRRDDEDRYSREKRRRDDSSPSRRDDDKDDYNYARHGSSKSRKEHERDSVHDHHRED